MILMKENIVVDPMHTSVGEIECLHDSWNSGHNEARVVKIYSGGDD
jgi:hypothetical protein